MNRRNRLIILACMAVIIGFFLYRQSLDLYHNVRELHRPNPETRQIGEMRVHSWMTPKEVAARYHVSIKEVFHALKIKPAPGDENLPMNALKDKYHLSKEGLKKALHGLNDPRRRGKVDFHE